MNALSLSMRSVASRPMSFSLTMLMLSLGFVMLMSVDTLHRTVPLSFQKAISGTDLIVGAATGPVSLLLYTAFRIGYPGANISYSLYEQMRSHPDVKWAIPISLGDSHRGYPVIATTQDYFDHFQYGDDRSLIISQGDEIGFGDRMDAVVIGAAVASELSYELGQKLTISHGMDEVSFENHENVLFEVTGILAQTHTPVDHSLHITLEAFEAVHSGWSYLESADSDDQDTSLKPQQISALFLAVHSKVKIFSVQREIMNHPGYQAILPGVAFSELWQMLEIFERVLRVMGYVMIFCTMVGMICCLLMSLMIRQKEIVIIRALGGGPGFIASLIWIESMTTVVASALFAWVLSAVVLYGFSGLISDQWGVYLSTESLWSMDMALVMSTLGIGFAVGLIPAFIAYKQSAQSSMTVVAS